MNEKVRIVGYRNVDFTDEKSCRVEGYTLYYVQDVDDDVDDENVTGQIAGKQFISSRRVDYLPVLGDEVIFRYNKYGKIGSIEVV